MLIHLDYRNLYNLLKWLAMSRTALGIVGMVFHLA